MQWIASDSLFIWDRCCKQRIRREYPIAGPFAPVREPVRSVDVFASPSHSADNPQTAPSNGYAQFELRPVKLAVRSIAPEVRDKFEATLSKLIDPTLLQWNEEGRRSGRTDALAIEITLTDMKFVSGSKRFWIGPLAGSSHAAGTVAFIDAASGRELAHESFTDASGVWAGSGHRRRARQPHDLGTGEPDGQRHRPMRQRLLR